MKIRIFAVAAAMAAMSMLVGCDDQKSYAELLSEENIAANSFLANQRVVSSIPEDTIFEVGKDAPYYQLDEDGNVYMQVLNAGTKGNKAVYDQQIYFRFTRYNLYEYDGATNTLPTGSGNDGDLTSGSMYFRFGNSSSQASYQWGSGLQMPLAYLPIDCEVNIMIKSQMGLYSEIANVVPFLYNVRYFKSQL